MSDYYWQGKAAREEFLVRASDRNVVRLRDLHETAVIYPGAEIGRDVVIGPYCVISENAVIGDGTVIGSHVVIEGWTHIGKNCQISTGCVLGQMPQDVKYKGEKSYVRIGDNTMLREYVTISRGTEAGGFETRVGDDCFIMAYAHVAHDCKVGNKVIIVNGTSLGGHVTIEDRAVLGGMSGVHQFCKVGSMAMVGACTKVVKDVPPYIIADGNPARVCGVNVVGLRRNEVSPEVRNEIRKAYKILYRSNLNVSQALEQINEELVSCGEIDHFIRFIRSAERGITK